MSSTLSLTMSDSSTQRSNEVRNARLSPITAGRTFGSTEIIKENGLKWTSLYCSLVTTIYGLGTADGLNERGLAAHMLFLTATDFGPRDPSRPGLHAGLWAQYILDSAATVTARDKARIRDFIERSFMSECASFAARGSRNEARRRAGSYEGTMTLLSCVHM